MLHRRFFAALAALCFILVPAYAWAQAKTKAAITTEINTNFPSGCTGCVTDALLRGAFLDIVNSYVDYNGGLTFTCPANQWVSSGTLSSLTCTQPAATVPVFDTVAAATAATISATGTATIYIRGFSVAGDAGGGFWTRSASMPVPTARFQSVDGAWWSPSLANGVFPFEMFGGSCGGSGFDNTPAMDKYNSFINTNGQQRLRLQPCSYFHNTQPASFNPVAPYIEGTGANGTVLMRNYNGTAGVGFLTMTGASGTVIQNLEVGGNTGTNTGDAIRFNATSSNGASGSYLQNVTIAGFGTDNFQNMVTIDGHLKVTGAIGSRENTWSNVTIFGSATSAINALSAEGFTLHGGGIFPAGGTSAAPIILSGLTTPMASSNVNINVSIGNDIQLDFCTDCILRAGAWSNVFNTTNTILSGVAGNVPGTKNANWINSNYAPF